MGIKNSVNFSFSLLIFEMKYLAFQNKYYLNILGQNYSYVHNFSFMLVVLRNNTDCGSFYSNVYIFI